MNIYAGLNQGNMMGMVNMQNQMANIQNQMAQHNGQQAMGNQQGYQNAANQAAQAQYIPPMAQWMINGRTYSLQEFIDTVFPEDSPAKTFFVLKHTNITGETK
jgi:hypothetical protein